MNLKVIYKKYKFLPIKSKTKKAIYQNQNKSAHLQRVKKFMTYPPKNKSILLI